MTMEREHDRLDEIDATGTLSPAGTVSAGGPVGDVLPRDLGQVGASGTILPRDLGPVPPRRNLRGVRSDELFNVIGAISTGLCVATLLFAWLAPFSGVLGFIVVAYLAFLATYAVLSGYSGDGPTVRDRLWGSVIASAAAILFSALGFVVVFTMVRGTKAMLHLNFFTQDLSNAGPLDPLTQGGVLHAVVGTLEMIAIALIITIPLGVLCAIYLTQIGGPGSGLVRTIVEAMTALPSIVAGLFIYATLILILDFNQSGFAAATAISVMMLPIMIRAADVVLRLVPGSLREASEALGAPRWRTAWYVVLPTARSGLVTSVILATARGVGETSPVLLTAGYTTYLNANPFSGNQVSLPLLTFMLVRSGQPEYIERGFGAAALLMLIVVSLFVLARTFAGRAPGRVTAGQARRLNRRSARDQERMERRQLELTDQAYDPDRAYDLDPRSAHLGDRQ